MALNKCIKDAKKKLFAISHMLSLEGTLVLPNGLYITTFCPDDFITEDVL